MNKRPEYPSVESLYINASDVFEYGNINLTLRDFIKLKDGEIASLLSITILQQQFMSGAIAPVKQAFIVIPTINEDGVVLTDKQAKTLFESTGKHLGKFATQKIADTYAKELSRLENLRYKEQSKNADYLKGEANWTPIEQIVDGDSRNLGGIVQLADLYGAAAKNFSNNLLAVSVSYSMDLNPEISIELIDEDYKMFDNNYFVIQRDVIYRGRRYEISDVSAKPGAGGSPSVVIKCRNKALQKMRRDKTPNSVTGSSGYEYAGNAAKKFGLDFVGQQTAKTKSTFKAKTGDGEESVWDVLGRTASDNQFVCFESDGVLVYASQEFLLYKFGSSSFDKQKFVPLLFTPNFDAKELYDELMIGTPGVLFELETWHDFNSSDNEPMAASGSCRVLMPQGGALRPGHTAICGPFPLYFFGAYLITDVSFSEGSPDSVQVSFRTPEEPKDQKGKPLKPRVGNRPGVI